MYSLKTVTRFQTVTSENNFENNSENNSENNKKHYPQNHFKILLVGKTGAGKSSIINTITNYFRNVSLDNIKVAIQAKWYKVTEEDFPVNSEADVNKIFARQTSFCINYDFTDPGNTASNYTFIDTPGLSDTRGDEQDDLNLQKIIENAISQHQLSAIKKVTESLKNAFKRLSSSLPGNIVKENLLLVLTKTTKSSSSFSLDIFKNEVAEPKQIFYMNNMTFCSNPSVWYDDKKERTYLEIHWENSNEEIKKLLGEISKMKPAEILNAKINRQNIYLAKEKFVSAKEERNKMDELQPIFKTINEEIKVKSNINTDYANSVCIKCEKVVMKIAEEFLQFDVIAFRFDHPSATNVAVV
ncbi:25842_t:CDS:2 [Gigaspora margarita]|uniref:25842_t:CDS:1 n=1 Tax=Gigaspora margarita TaxID=4874 RepID=A0ABN7UCZ4_GIGMA|nr:25842_t:CDS:2 [Gigaspora margarita]